MLPVAQMQFADVKAVKFYHQVKVHWLALHKDMHRDVNQDVYINPDATEAICQQHTPRMLNEW